MASVLLLDPNGKKRYAVQMLRRSKERSDSDSAPGHDAWFRAKVRSALREADRRPDDFIEHDDAVRRLDEAISRGMAKPGSHKP